MIDGQIIIRKYKASDLDQMATLFFDTVHTINAKDYSEDQLFVWAPTEERESVIEKWAVTFALHSTFVACMNSRIVGFGDISGDGYLDRLYVHKEYQGQGIASALVEKLEAVAWRQKVDEIRVDASITAQPFFLKKGYETVTAQTVERKGVQLTNFKMIKKR